MIDHEPSLSLNLSFEDSIWSENETSTAKLNQIESGLLARSRLTLLPLAKILGQESLYLKTM